MRKNLALVDVKDLREEFDYIDADKSGECSVEELGEMIRQIMGDDIKDDLLKAIFLALNEDGEGDVSWEEWRNFLHQREGSP